MATSSPSPNSSQPESGNHPPSQSGYFGPTIGPLRPESRARALLAKVYVSLIVISVPVMVGLIGYRSLKIHTPSSALLVGGDISIEGAKIEVTDPVSHQEIAVSTISHLENFESPILLDPKRYHVTVTHHGNALLNEDFEPHPLWGVRFDLKSMVTIIGSRALADARVEIVYSGTNPRIPRKIRVPLSAASHFRENVYLYAGEEYQVIAREPLPGNQVLAQTTFTIDRSTVTHIDLGKVFEEGTD